MTGNANGTGRTAFAGNIVPASRIDPGIQALLKLNEWPNPDTTGTGAYGLVAGTTTARASAARTATSTTPS